MHDPGYTSGLLLLDEFWTSVSLPVAGGNVAFPATRDVTAVTGTLDNTSLRIAAKAREIFKADPYPLTELGFERKDDMVWQSKSSKPE